MATDIAFVLGVLALLGSRVPTSLKVFLTALAIVDDLGAVLVIALFYSPGISWMSLTINAGILGLLIGANRLRIRSPLVYGLLGIGLWLAFLYSGVHPTIAGVLLAMTIPTRTRIGADELLSKGRYILKEFERADENGNSGGVLRNQRQQEALQELVATSRSAETPLQRLEHSLHPWVAFAIMPVFALANAGVALHTGLTTALTHTVTFGIIAGLVAGKLLGITLAAWFVVGSGLAALPSDVTWRQIYGAGWLGGIGFTMSLFISGLALAGTELLPEAKVGIMAASIIAGIGGWLILRSSHQTLEEAATTGD
jgi:NhaA family Na+:H+ antiporter